MVSRLTQSLRAMVLTMVAVPVLATSLVAAPPEPGWAGRIVVTGHERDVVKSTPIEMRPYRPLHVYGNTVRRRYYHGTALPAPGKLLTNSGPTAGARIR